MSEDFYIPPQILVEFGLIWRTRFTRTWAAPDSVLHVNGWSSCSVSGAQLPFCPEVSWHHALPWLDLHPCTGSSVFPFSLESGVIWLWRFVL